MAGYAAAACAALAAAAAVLQLWRADLTVPLYDAGDNLMAQMFVRNVLDTGGVFDGARLGAPGVMDLRDYPIPDVLHIAVLRLLGCCSQNAAVVLNLSYLLAFLLTGLSAYFTLRRLRLGRLAALVPAVLYTCLPYHFCRIQGHVVLSSYYLVPPMRWIALRVSLGRNPLLRALTQPGSPALAQHGSPDRPRWRLRSWEAAGAALLCILTGLAGVYYAFFACFFLLAAGARAAVRERRWAPAAAAAVLVLLIAGAVAAALAPTWLHGALHGPNREVAARLPAEADFYGLNISEMLLPVYQHRVGFLARLGEHFRAPPRRTTGEWGSEALGAVAAVGFLYLVGRFLLRGRGRPERAEDGLAFFTVAAVLLGTVGGFGSCFAFYVTPMIRCYNRISVCIAFFALAGLFLLAQRLTQRYVRGRWSRAAWAAGLVVLAPLGALDQFSPAWTPAYAGVRRQFVSDEDFGRRIEAALPAGSMVYQMPYVPFPEYPGVENLGSYELLRPFLHTRTLCWSYGAMTGRDANRWQADLAKRPLPDIVETLALAGFRGVYLDRAGFSDGGAKEVAELSRLLGVESLVSLSGRQTFFDMTPYVQALRARFTDQEWEQRQDQLAYPVELRWDESFRPAEKSPAEGSWRWCGAEGVLHVVNPSPRPRRVVLKMECSGLWDQKAPSRLVVDGAAGRHELSLTAERRPLELDVPVPPGDNVLRFSCDGRRLRTDSGEVVFRIWDFEYRVDR